MTVTFSVNDETTQVSRVRGLLSFVRNLPQFKTLLKRDGLLKGADADLVSILASWVGDDVRGCLIESAANYTGTADSGDEEQEMDRSSELMLKLQQIKAEEAKLKKEKEAHVEVGHDDALTLEHPPDDEDALFHPELLGEFEDVEGLSVEGMEEETTKKDEGKVENPKEGDSPKDEKKQKESDQGQDKEEDDADDETLKHAELEHPVDEARWENKEEQEKKADKPPQAAHHHDSHHRYHKQQNRRRAWP
jgi:hypothetical protein